MIDEEILEYMEVPVLFTIMKVFECDCQEICIKILKKFKVYQKL